MLTRNIIQRKNINSYNSNKNKHAKYAMQLLLPVPHKACTHLHIPTINYRVLKFKRHIHGQASLTLGAILCLGSSTV